MTTTSKSFQIVDDKKLQSDEILSGSTTVVRRQKTLSGDIIVKTRKKTNAKTNTPEQWLEKQKNAKKIADEIRAKNNSAYVVPRTFVSHNHVREQLVTGQRWRAVFRTMSPEDQKWAFKAVAEFVNDMSELRPIKYQKNTNTVPRLPVKNVDELIKILDSWDEKYVSKEDKKLIVDIYKYLTAIPENKLMVFGHNDLHGDNVIIDIDNRQIAIIDFELSGYKSVYDAMYGGMLDSECFWQYVNMLPRTKNPKLSWDFVREHRNLHKFLSWGCYEIIVLGKSIESMSDTIKKQCQRIRPIFATAKLKSKILAEKQKMSLVPLSHYEKG